MKYHDKAEYQNVIARIENEISTGINPEAFKELEELTKKDNDLIGLAAVNFYTIWNVGTVDFSKTIELADKALSYAIAGGSEYFALRAYNSLGIDYSEKADFFKSMNYYIKAYHIAINHPDYGFETIILNNIGNLFVWLKDYETAVSFIESAYEQEIKSPYEDRLFLLKQIVLNIIELYSYMDDYSKVDYWINVDVNMDEERKKVIEIICTMNDIVQFRGSQEELTKKIEKYLLLVEENDDFIYIFRSLLKVLDFAIHNGTQEICEKLIFEMKQRRNQTSMAMHDLYFYECLYEFDTKFKHQGKTPSQNFLKYYHLSKDMLDLLKTVCSKNLMIEIALDNARDQKEDILVECTILLEKAEKDPFTQLYNKVYMSDKITEELRKNRIRGNSEVSVLLFLDIDYFKQINDTLGHHKGDEILLKVSEILRRGKSDKTIVGRYGGDEFLIYSTEFISIEVVEEKVKELCEEMKKIEVPMKNMKNITCSVGVAISKKAKDFKELCRVADTALYYVKENGRNGYSITIDE